MKTKIPIKVYIILLLIGLLFVTAGEPNTKDANLGMTAEDSTTLTNKGFTDISTSVTVCSGNQCQIVLHQDGKLDKTVKFRANCYDTASIRTPVKETHPQGGMYYYAVPRNCTETEIEYKRNKAINETLHNLASGLRDRDSRNNVVKVDRGDVNVGDRD